MRFHFCALFFLLASFWSRANQVIHVNPDGVMNINSGFVALYDSEKSMKLEDVVRKFQESKFSAPVPDSFKAGYNVYWLHFKIKDSTDRDEQWILDFQNWSIVTIYIRNDSGFETKQTGHLIPFPQRDYPVANKAYALIPLKSDETIECFVRLESKYNNDLVPENLNFKIAPRQIIDKENSHTGIFIYSALAVLFVMFVYNLFIFFSTRLRSYAYYLLVILFALYHTAYNSGYIIQTFRGIPNFPFWLTKFETISSTLFGISILLFAHEFLKIRNRYPFWNKVIRIILISYVVFGVVLLFNRDIGDMTSALSGFATVATIMVVGIKSVKDKYPSALYFLSGYTVFLLAIMVIILVVLGVLPKNTWTLEYSIPLGTTIEILLFSFALGNMINILRKENEANQAQIILQLQENQELQSKVNRELEQKVSERTAELNREKELVTQQRDEIEKEREKSEELLINILPEETAAELKTNGHAAPQFFEAATVLFTDFVGFTQISEHLRADELVSNLDACFQSFDEIITNNGLEKIKTIGDSYMAACGLPSLDSDHAKKTIRAALEIIAFIDQWNRTKIEKGKEPWHIRVGIHSGPVVAGVVGRRKFAFDIWGDTVNTASRIEASGELGKINISGSTYELVKNDFECIYRGRIPAKNKGDIDMYFVKN